MFRLFKKIRAKFLKSDDYRRYFFYALGEIFLVVIGILIALQINNWNEARKAKATLYTNIKTIANDILFDINDLKYIIKTLDDQVVAGDMIIPQLESDSPVISDSLGFILSFNVFTTTSFFTERKNTWDYLSASGNMAEFPDTILLALLQDYYSAFSTKKSNYEMTCIPTRLEIRELKYELFNNSEHRKFFPTKDPKTPGKEVYDAIFNDHRILPLSRYIASTGAYFSNSYNSSLRDAQNLILYIKENYP